MGNFKDAVLQFAGILPVKQKSNAVGRPASQTNAVEKDTPGNIAAKYAAPPVRDAAIDRSDLEAKIASMRCDVHPLYLLQDATIEMMLPNSTVATRTKGSTCTKLSCNRRYLQEVGYFQFTAGEHPDFGQMELKSRCVKHESLYMTVAKINGTFVWVCLQLGCTNSAPYDEPPPHS